MVRLTLVRLSLLLSVAGVGLLGSARTSASSPPSLVPNGWPKVLMIKSIGVRAPVESLAFSTEADVHAPYKWGDVAWYDRGPRPGDQGRAQIYGHVDSYCCPAVFYRLRELKKGNVIQVQYRDGRTLSFAIQWEAIYANNKLPINFIYQNTTERGLLLLTCTGVFHRDGSGYDHKRVVYAKLIMPPGHPA